MKPPLYYQSVNTPLGLMLLAGTDQAVSALALGEDEAELLAWAQQSYPGRQFLPDQTGLLVAWVSAVQAYLVDGTRGCTLPVEVHGTPFQLRVWQQLQQLEPGQTCTYSELAAALGQPKAVRAVANACGANPVALVIPCHRVLRSDGKLGGFGWGVERKAKLLALENPDAHAHDCPYLK